MLCSWLFCRQCVRHYLVTISQQHASGAPSTEWSGKLLYLCMCLIATNLMHPGGPPQLGPFCTGVRRQIDQVKPESDLCVCVLVCACVIVTLVCVSMCVYIYYGGCVGVGHTQCV